MFKRMSVDQLERPLNPFAQRIAENKNYCWTKDTGHRESWAEVTDRLVEHIIKPHMPSLSERMRKVILRRQFIPGGRYIYATGRPTQQVNNCCLLRVQDSKEGWAQTAKEAFSSLMTGMGIGIVYSDIREEGAFIRGMGGVCTGPIALMKAMNECGRQIMQGGSRRSAIWAGLIWNHPDIFKFITIKDWSEDIKYCKKRDFNFPAPMDGTNISIILDDDFFGAYYDKDDPQHSLAHKVYWTAVAHMLRTGEPGFSVDTGENTGKNLRNAPVHGDTKVLTADGYRPVGEIVNTPTMVWTGKQWAQDVVFKKTGEMVETVRVKMTGGREIVCDPSHPFLVEEYQGAGKYRRLAGVQRIPASELQEGDIISIGFPEVAKQELSKEAYTLGYLYGDGSFYGGRAEVTFCTDGKKQCYQNFSKIWGHTIKEKDSRGYTRVYFEKNDVFYNRSKDRCPTFLTPEWTTSFLAGLFDADGNVDMKQKRVRLSSVQKEFLQGVNRLLESVGILANISKGGPSGYGGNVSWQLVVASDYNQKFMEIIPTIRVRYDFSDYKAYRKSTVKVISVESDEPADVYCADVKVEEHSFQAEGVLISNCTEIDSADNLDICNLGSINMARIDTLEEFHDVVELGTAFLTCGTLASVLPVKEMYQVREKNRRLGLGLMGLHAWLLRRGKSYGKDDELGQWLGIYKSNTGMAHEMQDRLGISRSVATRSVAPNGTISIIGETTGGIEPIFAVAYKRRFLEGLTWKAQCIIDPTAKLLIDEYGVDPNSIEDAFTLADDPERRLEFQAWVQSYVDHGISSTLNLPEWGSSTNNENTVDRFGRTFLKNLPNLRGMTTYPNGAIDGQPLVRMSYYEAVSRGIGIEFDDGCVQSQADTETVVENIGYRTRVVSKAVLALSSHPEHKSATKTVEQELAEIPLGAMCKNGVCGE